MSMSDKSPPLLDSAPPCLGGRVACIEHPTLTDLGITLPCRFPYPDLLHLFQRLLSEFGPPHSTGSIDAGADGLHATYVSMSL